MLLNLKLSKDMSKACSNDLRSIALKLIEDDKTKTDVSDLLGITIQTLCKWWKLYKEKGITEPIKPMFERKTKVDRQDLLFFVKENPDKTLKELGKAFGVSDVGVLKILRKLNITYKKTLLIRGEKGRFKRRVSKETE